MVVARGWRTGETRAGTDPEVVRIPHPEPNGDAVRVLIVDDHPVLRGGVRLACDGSERLEVVGEAARGEDALDACRRLRPDVVVLDLRLPGMSGLEVARRIREERLPTKILAFTGSTDDHTIFECMRVGADGFIEKSASILTIVDAIEYVATGGRVFTSTQEACAMAELRRMARLARQTARPTASLTRREVEVLQLVAKGHTIQQAASRLGVSPRTVESHIGSLYRKLGVETRVQALAVAARMELIDVGAHGGSQARAGPSP